MDGECDLTRGDDAQRRRMSVVQIRERVRPAAPDSESPDEWSTRNADALTVRSIKTAPPSAIPDNATPADEAAIFDLHTIPGDNAAELDAERPTSTSTARPPADAVAELGTNPAPTIRVGKHIDTPHRGDRTIRWRRIVAACGLLAAVVVVVVLADSLTQPGQKPHTSPRPPVAHTAAPALPALSFTAVNHALAHAVSSIEAREKKAHAAAAAHRRAQARKQTRQAHAAARSRRRAAAAKRAQQQPTTTTPVTSDTPTSPASTSTPVAAPAVAPAPTSSSTSSKPKAFGEGGLLGAGHAG
jgi:hypothetical protein